LSQCSGANVGNEQYLIISYCVVGAICVGLALATYALLRRSFRALSATAPGGRLGGILRRLFLIGIIVPALFGFFSVTFRSCGKETYEAIIADQAYVVAKNQEQLSAALFYIAIALLVWGLIISVGFVLLGKKEERDGGTLRLRPC
jgi:hypothetical protein